MERKTPKEIRRREILKKSQWQILLPRLLLGFIFTASGLNGFFHILPEQPLSTEGQAYIQAIREAGLIWPIIKGAELVAGLLLLFNFAGQLAVLILVPICLGIVVFHWFLSPQGAWIAWIAFALQITMIIIYRKNFMSMFKGKDDDAKILQREHERKGESELGDIVLDN
jgi:uncharacterized membrane protein YphA (DoxX/SURF4 family)